MQIEKLPSGSYRIRQQHNNKLYSITVPYKPTKTEAAELIAEKIKQPVIVKSRKTFEDVAKDYIELKRNVLSPRSVREYGLMIYRLPTWFIELKNHEITKEDVQKCINELAEDKAPKTVSCLHGFISSVLGVYRTDLKLSTTLPQKVKREPYIPTSSEVKKLLEYTDKKNPDFWVGIALASHGLRRSEIMGASVDDLDDNNILNVHTALVEDEDNNWVEKTTKTTESTRQVPISPKVANRIRQQGFIYEGGASSLSNFMKRAEKELGIQEFSLHKLRHYYASTLLSQNVPMKDVMALGGWENDTVLKEIYSHAMKAKTNQGKIKINKRMWKEIL